MHDQEAPQVTLPPALPPVRLTAEQVAIIEYVRSGTGHVLVEALAGSGKTSTILESLKVTTARKVLLCAFGNANARTLEARMPAPPRGCDHRARTLHSQGFSVLRSHGCRAETRDDATEQLVNTVADAIEEIVTKDRKAALARGVPIEAWIDWLPTAFVEGTDTATISLDVRRSAITILRRLKDTCVDQDVVEDEIEVLGQEIEAFGRIGDSDVEITCAIVRYAYLSGARLDRDTIDFCDQIWLPMVLSLQPKWRYDLVFVDEGQDLSEPQLELAWRLVADQGRLVVVGDLRQSVYGWRGAVGDLVWAKLLRAGAVAMPLTASFRCARAVVAAANEIVPQLRACADAPIGEVRACTSAQMLAELPFTAESTFVLSRTNAKLFRVAIRLWRQRAHFRFQKSAELASGLRAILGKLVTRDVDSFRQSLDTWHKAERARAEKRSAVAWADRLDQQRDMLLSLLECGEPRDLRRVLDDVVASKGSLLTLSTVHTAKGLEADRVYLLRQTFARHRPKRNPDEETLMVLTDAVQMVAIPTWVGAGVVGVVGFFFTFLFTRAVKSVDDKLEGLVKAGEDHRIEDDRQFERIAQQQHGCM